MNREEEIINAGIDYMIANIYPSGISTTLRAEVAEFSRNRAFEAGARWADNHQWVSCKESLPEYEEQVLVHYEDWGETFNHRSRNYAVGMSENGWCAHFSRAEPTHWMPIPPIIEETQEDEGRT